MHKIIIVPSSDDERTFDEIAHTFEEAETLMVEQPDTSASIREFKTLPELNAYIQGYEDAIGWLGNGLFYTNTEDES